jgi:hypothetical protein
MPRVADHRRIKRHRTYAVDEAARTLGVAKGTVRLWIKKGLPVLADQRPMLILGGDLIDFLVARERPRQSCALHECFCFSCRAPRSPAFDAVEYHSFSAISGNLRGLCSVCSTVMHKRISFARLYDLRQILEVTIVEGQRPLSEIDEPCVNDYLDKELETHA